jgi:hypothetical protein
MGNEICMQEVESIQVFFKSNIPEVRVDMEAELLKWLPR